MAPLENDLAERALRSTVIARKTSGGTRSPRGSQTVAILRSLFGTWDRRGLAPLDACLGLFTPAAPRAPHKIILNDSELLPVLPGGGEAEADANPYAVRSRRGACGHVGVWLALGRASFRPAVGNPRQTRTLAL